MLITRNYGAILSISRDVTTAILESVFIIFNVSQKGFLALKSISNNLLLMRKLKVIKTLFNVAKLSWVTCNHTKRI